MPVTWATKLNDSKEDSHEARSSYDDHVAVREPDGSGQQELLAVSEAPRLVMVVATLFQGKALMRCWFTANEGTDHGEELSRRFRGSLHSTTWGEDFYSRIMAVDVSPESDWTGGVHVNGDAVCFDFSFAHANGEGFTHTACEKFIAVADLLGDPDYRKRYYLPYPEVSQVTMVEAYADNNWVEYGEYMWERFFAPKADAAADAAVNAR